MKKIFAFSLAETLTTLVLIGVIAALTIPVLNNNTTDQKRMAMLKKLYASYNINIQTVINKDGCNSIGCLRAYGKKNANDTLIDVEYNPITTQGLHNKIFADSSYFKISATCSHCFPEPTGNKNFLSDAFGINYAEAGEDGKVSTITNASVYILNDSTVAVLHDYENNCVTTGKVTNDGVDVPVCGILLLDINGEKAPNSPGRDRYAYYIANEPVGGSFLIPVGYKASNADDNKSNYNADGKINSTIGNDKCTSGTTNGYNCTAKFMINNWQITEDDE